VLDGHIVCEPIVEGGKPVYRFTATGTFDRLLTGVKVVNESGGGQVIQPSLAPLLRFENKAPRSKLRGITELNFDDSSETGRNRGEPRSKLRGIFKFKGLLWRPRSLTCGLRM
jgi:hypothetical protein